MINPAYNKRDGESDYEYGLRLIEIKVENNPEDLDWQDIVDMLGLDYHRDSLRKAAAVTDFSGYKVMQYFKKKYAVKDKEDNLYLDEIELKTIDLKKDRQRFFDQRSALNKIIRERARQEELNDIIVKTITENKLPVLNYIQGEIKTSDNDVLVSLNDIHYGADVNNYWNTYNSDVCKNMLCRYIDEIIKAAKTHNSENCIIWANGDLISGNIHHSIAVANRENIIEQIMGVSELISEFIWALSSNFNKIRFMSVAGNHSRIDTKDRAVQAERLDDIIEWYLKARLQNVENVSFDGYERIDPTMYMAEIRGKTYLGVHGDQDPSPSRIQSLVTMAKKPVYAVLSGHKHHNHIDTIQGVKTVMAGSFLGMDDHTVNLRIFGKPEQIVSVVNENGFVCHYDIQLKYSE